MSNERQYVRVIYRIRRPPRATDDAQMIINAKKIINKHFVKHIVPFDLSNYSYITLENSGLRIRIDEHDNNSYRIDINLNEERSGDIVDIFLSPASMATQCLSELEEVNEQRIVKCYVSFELVMAEKSKRSRSNPESTSATEK